MRILAVDDDPIILDLLKGSLTAHDQYELMCSASAEQALQTVAAETVPIDCFLLDIMLPGVDGIELCDRIRKLRQYRTTPIIMITASRDPELMGRAFEAGATDFISKPLDGVELGARINSAAMLNDSLHREREAQHTLAELSEKLKIRFEEPLQIDAQGVTDLLTLENDLLRMPVGVYAMNLVAIDVMGLRGVLRAVGGPGFRYNLEQVAEAAKEAFEGRAWKMGYAGSGRFMAVVLGRKRLNLEILRENISDALSARWNSNASGNPVPPSLQISSLTDQRLWSALSASNKLREHLDRTDMMQGLAQERESELFERLDDVSI
ncbi:MAG: DNA-binding response OmpR family regulator [Sulfitobacter sp.]|jgi:DNA-binding response OmpR family regulator